MTAARVGRGPRARSAPARTAGDDPGLVALVSLLAPLWLLGLHQACGELLAVGGVAPDVLTLAVAVMAWTRPGFAAVLFAVGVGLGADVTSAIPWGLDGARMGLLAAVFVSLRQGMATEVPGSNGLMVAALVLVLELSRALVLHSWLPGLSLEVALPRAAWIALCTTTLVPLALLVARSLEPGGGRRP